MMKMLSLFSGIGAFECALDNQGVDFELVGYCEIDKYASKSYSAIHGVPESMNYGDITKIDEKKLPKDIDLITYGFPCQDISLAGKQKGIIKGETRSGLFFEALRIIEETQPKIAIAENVKNLTSKKFADQFKIVLDSLEQAGYNNYWKILNAKDYGVPQNRERVFIVSIRKDIDHGVFQFPEGYELNKRLKDVLEDEVDEKFYLSDDVNKRFKVTDSTFEKNVIGTTKPEFRTIGQRDWVYKQDSIMGSLVATDYKQPKQILDSPIRLGNIYGEHCGTGYAGNVWDKEAISPTLMTMTGGNRQPMVTNKLRIRKLTPKECFRLMGFDDADFDEAQKVNSNTQLYKQAGNSIVVDVLEELFCQMFDEDGNFFITLSDENIQQKEIKQ